MPSKLNHRIALIQTSLFRLDDELTFHTGNICIKAYKEINTVLKILKFVCNNWSDENNGHCQNFGTLLYLYLDICQYINLIEICFVELPFITNNNNQ